MKPFNLKPLMAPLLAALTISGCFPSDPDPTFCNENVDCDRPEELGDKTFCDVDKLYGSELTNSCVVRPDVDACNRLEACDAAGAKPYCDDISVGVKGSCVECTEASHCASGSCNPDKTCMAFSCSVGTAGDAACVEADATKPYCGGGDLCVACLDSSHCSTSDAPVCNLDTNTCRGCEAHAECDSGICDMDTGICDSESGILYVTQAGTGTTCTRAVPCASINTALGLVGTKDTILVGAGSYAEQLAVTVNVTIIGQGVVILNPGLATQNDNVILVNSAVTVVLDGLKLAPGTANPNSDAVSCKGNADLTIMNSSVTGARDMGIIADNCTLSVTGSTISENQGIGVSASGGTLSVTGSTISENDGGGLDITSSDFTIVNNFIVGNGGNGTTAPGIAFSGNNPTQIFNFNTVAGNQVGNAMAKTGVTCETLAPFTGSGNIVYGGILGGGAVSDACLWEYSDIEGPVRPGTGNINTSPLFVDDAGIPKDYHIKTGSPCINEADPTATLTTDIDDEQRPKGGRHDIGADEAE